jgi:hypothetical protein
LHRSLGLAYLCSGCPRASRRLGHRRSPRRGLHRADTLKEKLNDIRISDFSPETDDKISILERALANCNDEQGVGFLVMGTVIDKKMLDHIQLKLYGYVTGGGSAFPRLLHLLSRQIRWVRALQCADTRAGGDVGGEAFCRCYGWRWELRSGKPHHSGGAQHASGSVNERPTESPLRLSLNTSRSGQVRCRHCGNENTTESQLPRYEP